MLEQITTGIAFYSFQGLKHTASTDDSLLLSLLITHLYDSPSDGELQYCWTHVWGFQYTATLSPTHSPMSVTQQKCFHIWHGWDRCILSECWIWILELYGVSREYCWSVAPAKTSLTHIIGEISQSHSCAAHSSHWSSWCPLMRCSVSIFPGSVEAVNNVQ